MRLPLKDETDQQSIDEKEFEKMVETYMESGYNYFDTAFPYHDGKSEEMLKKYLVKKYPRESYILADKMPSFSLENEEDLDKFFQI